MCILATLTCSRLGSRSGAQEGYSAKKLPYLKNSDGLQLMFFCCPEHKDLSRVFLLVFFVCFFKTDPLPTHS